MSNKKMIALGIVICLFCFMAIVFTGCGVVGPTGPTGPKGEQGQAGEDGAPGAGTQTIKSSVVIPDSPTGWKDIIMSEIKVSSSSGYFSTVSVYYRKLSTNMNVELPVEIKETDNSMTDLRYWFSEGRVRIEWTNESTIPASFEAVVTVVNK